MSPYSATENVVLSLIDLQYSWFGIYGEQMFAQEFGVNLCERASVPFPGDYSFLCFVLRFVYPLVDKNEDEKGGSN